MKWRQRFITSQVSPFYLGATVTALKALFVLFWVVPL